MPSTRDLRDSEYRALAELRYQIRCFLTFSEAAARAAGIEPQQHQLLLVLRSMRAPTRPTVRAVAQRLKIRHNSAVELVRRCVDRGFVHRETGEEDRREVSLRLTPAGTRLLRGLSIEHRTELRAAAPSLASALEAVLGSGTRRAGDTGRKRS
jgi:DNA-binding MarR family transcriptional regulator